ncbi:MAG: acyl carrier protein [Metamycoplasmataceae bacterium]
MDIKKTIFDIIFKKTGIKVNLDFTLEDVNLDSLDLIELVLEIEKTFSIKIEDEKLNALVSINDLVNVVAEKVKN